MAIVFMKNKHDKFKKSQKAQTKWIECQNYLGHNHESTPVPSGSNPTQKA